MDETRFKLSYRGSFFWLIFWFILFFPIGFVLLFTASSFNFKQKTYNLQYDGSRFWLCFWVLVFFPIAVLLLFLNGFSARLSKSNEVMEVPCCRKPSETENKEDVTK